MELLNKLNGFSKNKDLQENTNAKKIKPKKSAFSIFLNIEVTIVVALVVIFILPQLFGFIPKVVATGSMAPTVPAGSMAYVDTNIPTSQMKSGEIAEYKLSDDKQVLHRIYDVQGNTFTFKGDANKEPDQNTVEASDVVGLYMFHIPVIGYIYMFFDEHRVIIILLGVAINAIIWWFAERSLKRQEEEEAAREVEIENRIAEAVNAQLSKYDVENNNTIDTDSTTNQLTELETDQNRMSIYENDTNVSMQQPQTYQLQQEYQQIPQQIQQYTQPIIQQPTSNNIFADPALMAQYYCYYNMNYEQQNVPPTYAVSTAVPVTDVSADIITPSTKRYGMKEVKSPVISPIMANNF